MLTATLILGSGLVVVAIVVVARELDARSWRRKLVALELKLPSGLTVDDVAKFLGTVAAALHTPRHSLVPAAPLVLEVTSTHAGIRYVLLTPKNHLSTITNGLRAALPGARTDELPDYLNARPQPTVSGEAVLFNWRRQLAVDRAPITATAILAMLQPLRPSQTVVIQWILTGAPTPHPIASRARKVNEFFVLSAGDDLTDSEAIQAARRKQADPQLQCVLRVGVTAANKPLSYKLFSRVWNQHRGMNAPGVRLTRSWWLSARSAARRLSRLSLPVMSWPMLLSTRELAGLLPLPLGHTSLPGVRVGAARTLPPPHGMPARGVEIGVSNFDGTTPLRLSAEDRLRHVHAIGPTGAGKSTLLVNMVVQDIEAGHGVIAIDPKADFIADILDRVPDRRKDDVVLLDPSVTDRPLGFNLLQSAKDEHSRELITDHVVHIWHSLYHDSWGPRSEDILRSAVMTLLHTAPPDGSTFTLLEVPELLTNAQFRKYVISQPTVPGTLRTFWQWYQGLKEPEQLWVAGPVLNKLRSAVTRSPIRLSLGQSEGLDIEGIINSGKILLVPLSKGKLGTGTANLLGTLLLATIYQAIFRRVKLPQDKRRPVFIYLDEFQDILRLPGDLADMLAQARGLKAGYVLAHQHFGQLDNKQVRSALSGTVRTQIAFQTLRDDAVELAKSFGPRLTAEDLMNLGAWEIAARLCLNGQTAPPTTGSTHPLPDPIRDGRILADSSRQLHGTKRSDVEAAIAKRTTITQRTVPNHPAASSRTTTRFGREDLTNQEQANQGGDS